MSNRPILATTLAAIAVLLLLLVYRSCAGSGLHVDPHANREIEKAKHR